MHGAEIIQLVLESALLAFREQLSEEFCENKYGTKDFQDNWAHKI